MKNSCEIIAGLQRAAGHVASRGQHLVPVPILSPHKKGLQVNLFFPSRPACKDTCRSQCCPVPPGPWDVESLSPMVTAANR